MRKQLLGILFVFVILSSFSFAQEKPSPAPAAAPQEQKKTSDYNDEAFVIEKQTTSARFEKDGTGTRVMHGRVLVKTDHGVEVWGQLVFGYSTGNERFDSFRVQVHKPDGSVVTAAPDAFQDMTAPVARNAPMYTDYRERHITVPGLHPGDTLDYEVKIVTFTALAPGQFWFAYDFDDDNIVLDEQVEVNVPKDRLPKLKTKKDFDPIVADEGDRRIYRWKTSHLKRKTEEELEKEARQRPKRPEPPAVQLTTFQSWEQVGNWFRPLELERIKPTDAIKAKARELTKDKKTDEEKLQAIYDYVSKNIRYVSLSFGLGRYQPHPATEILDHQYGDCKDKHTLLASLLEASGLHAYPALINSGRNLDPDVPSPAQFDHVITYVPQGNDAIWIDSTNGIAPFGMLFFSLRATKALVVPSEGTAGLRDTPKNNPVPNTTLMEVDGKINELGKFTARVHHKLRGDLELYFRSSFHSTAEKDWKELIQRISGYQADITDIQTSGIDDFSKPFEVSYTVNIASYVPFASKRTQVLAPLPQLSMVNAGEEDDDSNTEPLVIGGGNSETTFRLKLELPDKYSVKVPVPVSVKRDYGQYDSQYKVEKNVITVQRTLTLVDRELAATRLRDYRAFVRAATADQRQQLAIETPTSAGEAEVPKEAKIDELLQTGSVALQNHDNGTALKVFQRATEVEPKNERAWLGLGWSYAALRKFDDAATAFRKLIELNPYTEYGYTALGSTLYQARRLAEAEEAFRKQVEINPLDEAAVQGLAGVLVEERKWTDAVSTLEKAASISPRDANIFIQLGDAYLEVGQKDKGIDALNQAAQLSNSSIIWNGVAYELGKRGLQLERAQQYAESAVSTTEAELRNVALENLTMHEVSLVDSMTAYWDTLGWLYFQRGNYEMARQLIEPSWIIGQIGESADHLAQIYEKMGKKDEAARYYAYGVAARRSFPESREHLKALIPDEKKMTAQIESATKQLVALKASSVRRQGEVAGSADFFMLVGANGKVEGAQFVRGDEKLRGYVGQLSAMRWPGNVPTGRQTRILRRGTLTCPAKGDCEFNFLLSDEISSVN